MGCSVNLLPKLIMETLISCYCVFASRDWTTHSSCLYGIVHLFLLTSLEQRRAKGCRFRAQLEQILIS